jgi:short-subunit dehydrogenase
MSTYNLLERFLFAPTYVNKERLKKELQGKTVLVTGASSGIGERVAYYLAEVEVRLILVARREEKLRIMKAEIEKKAAKVTIFRADLRNEAELGELLEFLHQFPHGLDVIVSNAGKSIKRPIKESLNRYHDFTRTISINYLAPVQLLLSVIPLLEKNKGHIINISTINALLIPFPYWAAYQASKSAFDTWFRSAAPELNTMGVATTSIYLPLVRTPMILPTKAYEKMPAMSSEHVAKIVCQSMLTKRKIYRPWWLIFGQLSSILFRGLWERSLPIILKRRGRQ